MKENYEDWKIEIAQVRSKWVFFLTKAVRLFFSEDRHSETLGEGSEIYPRTLLELIPKIVKLLIFPESIFLRGCIMNLI